MRLKIKYLRPMRRLKHLDVICKRSTVQTAYYTEISCVSKIACGMQCAGHDCASLYQCVLVACYSSGKDLSSVQVRRQWKADKWQKTSPVYRMGSDSSK